MTEGTRHAVGTVSIAVGFFIIGLSVGSVLSVDKYKQGQIAAINGQIEYELVTQENGETRWEKIK